MQIIVVFLVHISYQTSVRIQVYIVPGNFVNMCIKQCDKSYFERRLHHNVGWLVVLVFYGPSTQLGQFGHGHLT